MLHVLHVASVFCYYDGIDLTALSDDTVRYDWTARYNWARTTAARCCGGARALRARGRCTGRRRCSTGVC